MTERADPTGVLAPVPTPFDGVTGELDTVALRANLRALLEHPIRGVVLAGSTGEAVLLDEDERLRMVEAAREVVPGGRLLLAGTGAESTRATIRLTGAAAEAGADAVLVQPPAFYLPAMKPEVLVEHFRAVADASPVPVLLYQVPGRLSSIDLPAGLVGELRNHENVVGIKDSRGDLGRLGELVEVAGEGFRILVGSGAHLYGGLEVGAHGGILGVANLAPAAAAALYAAFEDGRAAEAGRLQERIGPVHVEVVGRYGVAGVKAALDLLGHHGGDPRPPLRPLPEKEREKVRATLERAGLI